MEQINSNDVNTNSDSLNREDSDDIIDLTGDDDAGVSDDTIYLNYSRDATLHRYIITKDVFLHNWRTTSSDLMENNSLEMNEPFNEEIDEDSSISTSQLKKDDGSSCSLCDKIDNDDIMYSMENNEYTLEFESRLGTINDIEYPVQPVQPIEHAVLPVQQVKHAVQPVENAVRPVENAGSIISLLSADEDEDNNTNPSSKQPEIAVVHFDGIHFIPTIGEQEMFPYYSQIIFKELIESLKRRCELQNTFGLGNFSFGIADLMNVFAPTKWLNDLVMNAYLKLIVSESKNVQYLSTYFIVKLKLAKHRINLKSKTYNNLYSFEKTLIPTHTKHTQHKIGRAHV